MRNFRGHRRWRTCCTLTTALVSAAALAGCAADEEGGVSKPSVPEVKALHDALPQSVKDAGVLRFAGDSHPPVTVTRALTPDASSRSSAELTAWARRRKELYGFAPDPGMPAYPFHPESRNTAIAVCRFDGDGLVEAALEPCWIDDRGRPVPYGDTEEGRRVTDYIEHITRTAGLNGRFVREDGRLLIELNTERAS
ncbi:hypothetical protein [Streptomyces olivaceus]